MSARRGGPRRSLLVPEVQQISPLDCGPAALAALLAGFGVPQPFARQREACRTGRDGTSIDALESVAVEHGLDAEQILVPVDHLALPEAACLPCILVVRQAGGATHFVVLWRRHGRRAQVMDPAAGRRWPTMAALEREVYRHRAVVPAAAWRAWAVSAGLHEPLAARLDALGLAGPERSPLLKALARPDGGAAWRTDAALDRHADEALDCHAATAEWRADAALDWRAPAALDAAARFTAQLVAAGGVRRGREAGRILSCLLDRLARQPPMPSAGGAPFGPSDDNGPVGSSGGGAPPIVPASCWSVRLAAPGPDGEERLAVEGAVLVRVRGHRPAVEPAGAAHAFRARLRRPAAAAVSRPRQARQQAAGQRAAEPTKRGPHSPSSPGQAAAGGPGDLPRRPPIPPAAVPAGLPRLPADTPAWFTLALATLGAAAGRVAEVALLAACVELLPGLGSRSLRLAALGSLLCLAAALLGLELAGARTALALGRGSETVLRLRLAAKLPRLPDRYLRTRADADLAERAHLLARVRRGPEILAATLRAAVDAALAAAGIAWLDPPLATAALGAGVAAVVVPLLLLPPLAERSRRASAHAAALGGFYLDVLRGVAAVRAHQAAPALRRRHDELLAGWLRARRSATAAGGWLEVSAQALLGAAAAGLVLAHVRREGVDPRTLVLALWASQLLGAGQRLAMLAGRELPLHRTLMRRIEEPLAEVSAGIESAAEVEPVAEDAARAEGITGTEDGIPAGSAHGDDALAGVAIGFAGCAIETDGRALLRDLDLDIPAGQHVAILGRSGAGKSTLLGTLLGWYRPAAGVLLLDGRPLGPRALGDLRRATAWVAPEVTLWSAPLLDNLLYGLDTGGSPPCPADRLTPAEALRAAQLLDLLPQLPAGLQTALGEAGGRLSGGEAMRLRLARALLRPGIRLALLDEPCRGLGADQRRELLAAARGRWRRATLLCVTHSPAEAAGFDRLLILDDGRVVEDGMPGPLAARPGSRYSALLDAEARAGAALEAPGWRRLRLVWGCLHEQAREDAAAKPTPSLPGGAAGYAVAPATLHDVAEPAGVEPDVVEADVEPDAVEADLVERDVVEIAWDELERVLPRLGPAVLRLPSGRGLLEAPRGRGRRVALLTPDGRRLHLSAAQLASALRQPLERRLAAGIEPLVGGLSLAPRRRRRTCRGLLAAHLAAAPGCTVHLLGAAEPADARLGFPAAALLAALAAGQALVLGAWYLLGSGLLAGLLDRAMALAWALLLLTLPLARAVELSAAAELGHRAVLLLRRRLAAALLSLPPETLRAEGTGSLMGRLLAAESIERLLLAAVPAVLLAAAELTGAAAALAHGAAPTAHLALLLGALLAAAALAWRYARAQRRCAADQRCLTGQLVEQLAGHRTRLAQQGTGPAPLEDSRLAAFHAAVRRMDDVAALLRSALPRAWLFAGLALLAAALAPGGTGGAADAAALAAALGGLLLAQAGLGRLAAGLCDLAAARAASHELRPFFKSGRPQPPPPGPLDLPFGQAPLLVEARDLACRPPGRPRPILASAALAIRRGDRLLLEGASGSGKSTFAALLASQLAPDSGLLLLDGFDLPTTGARAWRRRVVAVPQLHANHLFADTLAFNLLLGRGWPPAAGDLEHAAALCRDLGLGALLDRLPAGLEQRIGEAGWRLSDGEASRVCLARALLQDPDLLILDESLAALDPETRLLALDVAALRARTLLLIAHAAPR